MLVVLPTNNFRTIIFFFIVVFPETAMLQNFYVLRYLATPPSLYVSKSEPLSLVGTRHSTLSLRVQIRTFKSGAYLPLHPLSTCPNQNL